MGIGFVQFFESVGISGLIDIVFMSFLVYAALLWFKKAKAAAILAGIIVIGIFYLIAKQFNLELTASLFKQFFSVILIVVVVIFQEELKRIFEQIAIWSFADRNHSRRKLMKLSRKEVEIIIRTATDLAKARVGALIVIVGKDPIERHLDGAIDLKGELSDQILKSIFDPHSAGHDGAVIITNNKIAYFGCQLPLSKDFETLKRRGTRHAAALGLAERTDAFCIVVSEERGAISVAHNGEIYQIQDLEKLMVALEKFYREVLPSKEPRTVFNYITKNYPQKLLAIALTAVLWFVLVHESRLVYKNFDIPIKSAELSDDLVLIDTNPQKVNVTFSAPRRSFYFFKEEEVNLALKISRIAEGEKTVSISNTDIVYPNTLSLVKVEPRYVQVIIESKETTKLKEEMERLENEKLEREKKENEKKEKEQKENELKQMVI